MLMLCQRHGEAMPKLCQRYTDDILWGHIFWKYDKWSKKEKRNYENNIEGAFYTRDIQSWGALVRGLWLGAFSLGGPGVLKRSGCKKAPCGTKSFEAKLACCWMHTVFLVLNMCGIPCKVTCLTMTTNEPEASRCQSIIKLLWHDQMVLFNTKWCFLQSNCLKTSPTLTYPGVWDMLPWA